MVLTVGATVVDGTLSNGTALLLVIDTKFVVGDEYPVTAPDATGDVAVSKRKTKKWRKNFPVPLENDD